MDLDVESKNIEYDKSFKKKKTDRIIYQKSNEDISITKKNEIFKKNFLEFLAKMHNLLRGCAVTGEQALDDILYCLLLCYLENKITNQGEFDLENINHKCYEDIVPKKIKSYIKYLKVGYLLLNTEELRVKDSTNSIEKCAKLFSKHPKTKLLFSDKDFINCQDVGIFSKLLEECLKFSKEQTIFSNIDIIGIAYEYMNTKYSGNNGTSREMGQYFTERPLMEICFKLIDDNDIKELGINNDSTLGDEFCATFGFPLMARKFLKEKFNLDIKDKNMYGVEYHERLSRYAYMNALFSMNDVINITRGDSFYTNVTPHLDISIHNVPFGQSMTPKIIETNYKKIYIEQENYPKFEEYLPFCTKKIDSILASQVVIYKTKKMGLLIIKDGEETSNKNNSNFRKWFCEKSIVKKIMKIPGNAFSCTNTKTVCIYFIKKNNKITENIQFLELNEQSDKINEICNVTLNDLKENNYSWDHNSYILDESMENILSKSKCNWSKISEICEINLGERITKKNDHEKNGIYYVIGGGEENDNFKTNKFNRNNSTCKISRFAASIHNCVMLLDKKYWLNDSGFTINSKNQILENKYIAYYLYYYLNNNKSNFKKLYRGSGQQNIDIDVFNDILLPIPNKDIQYKIIDVLDNLSIQKNILFDRKKGINLQIKYYFENQIKNNDVEVKQLSELIKINIGSTPSTKNNQYWDNGENIWISVSDLDNNTIPIVDSKKKITNMAIKECKPKLVKKGTILMSFKLTIGKLGIAGCDLYTNEAILHVNTDNEELNRYLYYHLFSVPISHNASGCMGNGSLNKEKLKVLKIYIQKDLDKQKNIVNYLDKLESEKNSIDNKITDIDYLMKDILKNSYN